MNNLYCSVVVLLGTEACNIAASQTGTCWCISMLFVFNVSAPSWGCHALSNNTKILIASFPPCQQLVIWFLVKECCFGWQISPRTQVLPLFPPPPSGVPGDDGLVKASCGDDAPPWPGKDWGCQRTAGQVFWAAHRGASLGCSGWPTSISVPGEINGKMWPEQSDITAMAGGCSNNGE